MFDTLAVAQQFAAGGVDRDQAEVIANAILSSLKLPFSARSSSSSGLLGGGCPRSTSKL